ncbi:MAG TPA: nuclear transport factor 2 family protein [Candidatus Hydrogenedentes bacterium]|nr:nuclear transport factor 2 family protein [Candidatus Hydrogenedentota bacterium]
MKKSTILLSLTCVLSVSLLAGCSGLGGGPSDEELIEGQLQALHDALFAGDAETILALFSNDFSHYEVPDKSTLADYLEMGVDMGYLDDLESHGAQITWEEADITIEENTATVYPIDASADLGAVTLELTFKKESDGVWRIIGADVEGI